MLKVRDLCRGGDSSFLQLIIRGTRMLQWLQERETNHAILASESKGENNAPVPQLLQKPTRAEKGMAAACSRCQSDFDSKIIQETLNKPSLSLLGDSRQVHL